MNPIIQKNLAMKTQPNAQNSASQPNNDAQLDPVSYTHLDVYKRQPWLRSG